MKHRVARPGIGLPCLCLAVAVGIAVPDLAHATAAEASQRRAARLAVDLRLDIPILVVSIGVVVGTGVADLGPDSCRWCEREDLNSLDRWFRDKLRRNDPASLDMAVGAATGLLLLGTVGLETFGALSDGGGAHTLAVDALIIGEAVAVALALTSVSKAVVGRQRPYTLAVPDDVFDDSPRSKDENASFFSGHSAVAFSLAVSSAMVATLRGYRTAPYLWTAGLALAATTTLLRIGQDQHFFTDVLAGAIAGAGAGAGIPYLHRAAPVGIAAVPAPGGYQVVLAAHY